MLLSHKWCCLCVIFSVKIDSSLINKVQYLQRAKLWKQVVCVCTSLRNVHSFKADFYSTGILLPLWNHNVGIIYNHLLYIMKQDLGFPKNQKEERGEL